MNEVSVEVRHIDLALITGHEPGMDEDHEPGVMAKIVLTGPDGDSGEGVWAEIAARTSDGGYLGHLRNQPMGFHLVWGDPVYFRPEHIRETQAAA